MIIKAVVANFSQSEKGPVFDFYLLDDERLCLDRVVRKVDSMYEGSDAEGRYVIVKYEDTPYFEEVRNINQVARDTVKV